MKYHSFNNVVNGKCYINRLLLFKITIFYKNIMKQTAENKKISETLNYNYNITIIIKQINGTSSSILKNIVNNNLNSLHWSFKNNE